MTATFKELIEGIRNRRVTDPAQALADLLGAADWTFTTNLVTINRDPQTVPAAAVAADAAMLIVDNAAIAVEQLAIGTSLTIGNRFLTAGGTFATPTAIDTTNTVYMGYMGGGGFDGTDWQTSSAGLIGIKPGSTWSGSNRETFLAFETTPSGSTTRSRKARLTGVGNLDLELDNAELRIGAGQDLRLYHDGTNSNIRNNTGDLTITSATASSDIELNLNTGGAVWLLSDINEFQIGAGRDLRLYHDGTNSWINNDTGDLFVDPNGTLRLRGATDQLLQLETTDARPAPHYMSFVDPTGRTCYFGHAGSDDNISLVNETATGVLQFGTNSAIVLTLTAAGVVVTTAPVRLKGYTVAGLPAGTIGDTAYVTNALAPVFGAAVAGGGAVMVPVYYTGAAWFVG